MPNRPIPSLTNELLNKLFYIGEDKKLYRKPIQSSPFCCVNRWNLRAERKEPIAVDFVSLKPVGLSSYRTEIIIECLKYGCKKYYDSIRPKALIARERNLDKAVKAQKAKYVDNPHNLKNAAKKTQDMAALNRGVSKIIKSKAMSNENEKPTIAEVLSQARKTSNCREAYLSALKEGAYRV